MTSFLLKYVQEDNGLKPRDFHFESVGLLSLRKRRLKGNLIALFQYMKGAYSKGGVEERKKEEQ